MITSALTFNMEFPQHNDFKKSYFRNNRACGQKNIRCFPACADEHVEKHFCGRPLKVILEIEVQDGTFTCSQIMEEIRLIARFEVLGPDVSGIREPVSGSVLKSLIKTKANPTNPYFYGKVVETKVSLKTDKGTLHRCVVDFNSECKGWHYAWVGNRFRSNIPHIVSVSVMRVDRELSFGKDCPAVSTSELANQFGTQSIVFRPMAHFNSPSFLIASLRRKEEKVDEEEKAEEEMDGKEEEKEVDDDIPLSELVNKTPTVKQLSLREVGQESIREIQSDTLLGANANEERANSAAAKVVTSESYEAESTKRTSASTLVEEKRTRSDREKRDTSEVVSDKNSNNDKDSVGTSSSTSNGTSNSSSSSSGGVRDAQKKLKDVNLTHVLLQGNFISHTSSSPTPTAAAPVAGSSRISQRQHRASQQASERGPEKFSETKVDVAIKTTTGNDAHEKQLPDVSSSSPLSKVSTPASPAPVPATMRPSPAAGAAVVTGATAVGDVSSLPANHHIPLIPRVQTSIPTNDGNSKHTATKSYKNEAPNQFTLPSRTDVNNGLLSFSQQPLLHPMLSPMTDPFGRPMMMPQQTAQEPILFSQHEQLNANLTLQHQQFMQRQQQEMWVQYNLMQQQMYLNMMNQQSQSQANSSGLSSVSPSYLTASASAQLNQQMSNINSINSSSNNGGYLFPTNSSHYSTRGMTNQGSQPNTSAYSQTIQPLPLPSTFSAGKLSQMPPQLINPQYLSNPPNNSTALSPAAAAPGKYNRANDSMQQQQLTAADGAPVWNCFKPTLSSPTTVTSAVAAGNGRKVFGLPLDVFSDVVYDEVTFSGVAGLLECPEQSAIEAALNYLSEVRAREAAVEKQTELLMQILSAPCAALDFLADITTCWKPPGVGATCDNGAGIDTIAGVALTIDSESGNSSLSETISTPFARSTRSTRSSDQAHLPSERSNNANNSSYSSNKRKAVDVDELLFSETDDFYAANYKRASCNSNNNSKEQENDNLSGEKRQHKCPRCGAPKRGHRCSKVLPQTVRNKSLRYIGASSELFSPADVSI